MRKVIFASLFIATLTVSAIQSSQGEDSSKYGYVDVRKVLLESKTGKLKKAEMEKLIKQRKDQLVKEEQKLKTMRETYEKEQLILTDVLKQQRQKQFQEKLEAYRKMASEAQKELGQKDAEFSRAAMVTIREVVAKIAKEQNLNLVFEKNDQPVLFAKEGPDLTNLVIKRMNAKPGK